MIDPKKLLTVEIIDPKGRGAQNVLWISFDQERRTSAWIRISKSDADNYLPAFCIDSLGLCAFMSGREITFKNYRVFLCFARIGNEWFYRALPTDNTLDFQREIAILRANVQPDSIIGEVDEAAEMERLAEIATTVLRLTGLSNTVFSEIQDEHNFHLYNLFGGENAPAISIGLETTLRLHPETYAPQFAPLYTVTGYVHSLPTQNEPGETHNVDLSQHLKADDAVKAAILAVIEKRINLALCTA